MTASDLSALFAEVYAEYGIPELAEDEFTIAMFAKANGISPNRAEKILTLAVEDNALEEVGDRRHNNRKAKAYRKKQ